MTISEQARPAAAGVAVRPAVGGPVAGALRVRLGVVDAAGVVALVWSVWQVAGRGAPPWWSLLATLALQVAGRYVDLPLRVGQRRVQVAGLVEVGMLLGFVLTLWWTVLAVGAVALVRAVLRGVPAHKAAFNTAAFLAPTAAAAALVQSSAGAPVWARAAVLVAAGIMFSVLNMVAVQAVVAAASGDPLGRALRTGVLSTVAGAAGSSVLAALVVLELAGVPALLGALPAAAAGGVVFYRRTLGRESAVDVLPRLAAAGRPLGTLDAGRTVVELAERAVEVFGAQDVEVWLIDWPGSPGPRRWVRTGTEQGRWADAPAGAAATINSQGMLLADVDPTRVLCLPLVGRDVLIGEIRMAFGRAAAPSDTEQQVLDVFAALAASAVENARAYLLQHQLARRDPLTGAANRLALAEGLDALLPAVLDRRHPEAGADDRTVGDTDSAQVALWGGSRPRSGHPAAVVLVDLDNFKAVNDTLGHGAGDRLLVDVAAVLASCCRAGDVFARTGGDEFAVVFSEVTGAANAQGLAAQLITALSAVTSVTGTALQVRASAGVALTPDHGTTASDLLRRADLALLVAKHTKGRAVVYDDAMDAGSSQRVQTVTELTAALAGQSLTGGQVLVHYAPRVGLHPTQAGPSAVTHPGAAPAPAPAPAGEAGGPAGLGAAVVDVVAVPTWVHPDRGTLTGGRWLADAYASDLATPLTLHILDQGLRDCAQWHAQTGRWVGLVLDVPHRALIDAAFAGQVAQRLVRHGVPSRSLTVHLQDPATPAATPPGRPGAADPRRATLADTTTVWASAARASTDTLQSVGVQIALPAGHAVTLGGLAGSSADTVTLDEQMVAAACDTSAAGQPAARAARAALAGTAAIATDKGMTLTARRVPTDRERDLVAHHGVRTVQGHHHGGPVTARELGRILRATAS